MIKLSCRIGGFAPLALSIGLVVVPQAGAHGGRGGHGGGGHGGGGHAARCAPLLRTPADVWRTPNGSRDTAGKCSSISNSAANTHALTNTANSHANQSHAQSRNHSQALTNSTHASNNAAALASSTHARNNIAAVPGSTNMRNNVASPSATGSSTVGTGIPTTLGTMPTLSASSGVVPNSYTYGAGRGAQLPSVWLRERLPQPLLRPGIRIWQVPGTQPRSYRGVNVSPCKPHTCRATITRATASVRCMRSRWQYGSFHTDR